MKYIAANVGRNSTALCIVLIVSFFAFAFFSVILSVNLLLAKY